MKEYFDFFCLHCCNTAASFAMLLDNSRYATYRKPKGRFPLPEFTVRVHGPS